MNRISFKLFLPYFLPVLLLIFIAACGDSGYDRTEEEEDQGIVAEEPLGGRPSQSTVLVKGSFRTGYPACKDGFGLCDVELAGPEGGTHENIPEGGQENASNIYPATFILDTEDKETMKISFLQKIPFFEERFVVDSLRRGYANIFGADSVFVVPGVYQADQTVGDYGAVEVKIVRRGVQEPIN